MGHECAHHDAPIAFLAKADHLIVLSNHLRSALGEIEGKGSLIGTKVVDVEDKFLGQILGISPDNPANTGIDLQRRQPQAGLRDYDGVQSSRVHICAQRHLC